jgi:hypothetical protein
MSLDKKIASRMNIATKIEPWILEHWLIVAYLGVGPWEIDRLREMVKIKPNDQFYDIVGKHLNDYTQNGIEPPAAIASVIYNINDDMMAGRQPVLRTGDYLAIRNFMRT